MHFRSIFLLLLNTSRQSFAIWSSPIKKGQKIACLFRSLTLYTTYRNCFWILFITTVAVSFVTSSPLFVVRFTSGRKHGNQSFFFFSHLDNYVSTFNNREHVRKLQHDRMLLAAAIISGAGFIVEPRLQSYILEKVHEAVKIDMEDMSVMAAVVVSLLDRTV